MDNVAYKIRNIWKLPEDRFEIAIGGVQCTNHPKENVVLL